MPARKRDADAGRLARAVTFDTGLVTVYTYDRNDVRIGKVEVWEDEWRASREGCGGRGETESEPGA